LHEEKSGWPGVLDLRNLNLCLLASCKDIMIVKVDFGKGS
jgi:hypothetical protein